MFRFAIATVGALFMLVVPAWASSSAPACKEEASAPLVATNDLGDVVVAWQDSCGVEGVPSRSSIGTAIGNTRSGFAGMGIVSAAHALSYPAAVSLDDAGDAWVLGFDENIARGGKYETIEQKNTRVWLAFRPTGSSFHRLPALPTRGLATLSAVVAGNRAGVTLFAWSTQRGTFVAWGDETGKISTPQFFAHGLQVVSIGVDSVGRALIVGYYPGNQFSETARAIVTLAGRAGGAFSLHELARARRRPRKHLQGYLGEPVAAVGSNGDALVVWETNWVKQNYEEFAGPTITVHRRRGGRFNKPVHLAKAFFDYSTAWHGAAVDATGAAIVFRALLDGYRVTTLTPRGQVKSERRLPQPSGLSWPSFAANAQGQAVIGWAGPCRSCISTVAASTDGTTSDVQALAVANEVPGADVTMAVDGQGTATAVWMERTPTDEGYVVNARAIVPGAPVVPVALLPEVGNVR